MEDWEDGRSIQQVFSG